MTHSLPEVCYNRSVPRNLGLYLVSQTVLKLMAYITLKKHCSRHLLYLLVNGGFGRAVIYPKRYKQLLIFDRPNLWLALWTCFFCPYPPLCADNRLPTTLQTVPIFLHTHITQDHTKHLLNQKVRDFINSLRDPPKKIKSHTMNKNKHHVTRASFLLSVCPWDKVWSPWDSEVPPTHRPGFWILYYLQGLSVSSTET